MCMRVTCKSLATTPPTVIQYTQLCKVDVLYTATRAPGGKKVYQGTLEQKHSQGQFPD